MNNPSSPEKFLIFVKSPSFQGWIWRLSKYLQTPWELHSWWTKANMTHKLLSRDCSYRQTQKAKDQVWEGDRREGFIWTCSIAEMASFYQMSSYGFFLWWSARCSSLQKDYTFSGEYVFSQEKSVFSAMVKKFIRNSPWSHVHRSNNDDWKIRLQSLDAKDARAIDIKHNLSCYVRYVPRSETVIAPDDSDSNRTRTIAAEFYSLVKKALKEGKVFPITDVSTTYKAILDSIGITYIPTRRQFKEQIADNIYDVQFSQPRKKTSLNYCAPKLVKIRLSVSDFKRDMQSIFIAAHVIRDDIIQMWTDSWKFERHLDTTDRGKDIPHNLYSLLRWFTQRTAEFGSQNQFESCWEDNVSGEKPEASFLHSTKSWSRILLLNTLTYLYYLELVLKSMHTHVANTWLTSFMLVVYVLITLVFCQSKHILHRR